MYDNKTINPSCLIFECTSSWCKIYEISVLIVISFVSVYQWITYICTWLIKTVNRFRWPLHIYGTYVEISRERERSKRKVKHSITTRPMIHKSPFFIRFIYNCSFWRLFSILYIYLFLYVSVDCDIFYANKISPLKLVLRCFQHFIFDPFFMQNTY